MSAEYGPIPQRPSAETLDVSPIERSREGVAHAMLDCISKTTSTYQEFKQLAQRGTPMIPVPLGPNAGMFGELRTLYNPFFVVPGDAQNDFRDMTGTAIDEVNIALSELGGLPFDITDQRSRARYTGTITSFDFKPGEEDLWVVTVNSFPKPLELTAQRLIGSVIDGLNGTPSAPLAVVSESEAAATPQTHTGLYW